MKTHRSGFTETLERLNHELDKEDEGEAVKGFSVVCKELKKEIDFSCDILREDKVSTKMARTEKVVETEDEAIRVLLWEQIIMGIFVGQFWGNASRFKWQHQSGEKREDGDNVENSSEGVHGLDAEANRFPCYNQMGRYMR